MKDEPFEVLRIGHVRTKREVRFEWLRFRLASEVRLEAMSYRKQINGLSGQEFARRLREVISTPRLTETEQTTPPQATSSSPSPPQPVPVVCMLRDSPPCRRCRHTACLLLISVMRPLLERLCRSHRGEELLRSPGEHARVRSCHHLPCRPAYSVCSRLFDSFCSRR